MFAEGAAKREVGSAKSLCKIGGTSGDYVFAAVCAPGVDLSQKAVSEVIKSVREVPLCGSSLSLAIRAEVYGLARVGGKELCAG